LFWKRFGKLAKEVQQLARKNFALLKQDSRHQSLHFKRLGDYWSARVGLNYRALAVQDGSDYVWVWIELFQSCSTATEKFALAVVRARPLPVSAMI
jgi:hypothetical protein